MKTNLSFKIFIAGLFFSGVNTFAVAQKVQNVQENALWASTPVKVDGKITDEVFQAYNKSTLLSYTMSNDDKNLYLVIKSADHTNNNRIMMGGITLAINTDGKKKEKEAYSVTYPLLMRRQGGGQRSAGFGQQGRQGGQSGSADSAALARRKQQLAEVKEIKISGFKDIQDSLISIYNEYEILAVAKFDDKGTFVYELAIPLRSLELTDSSKEFAYNIKINGFQFGGGFGGGNMMRGDRPGGGGDFGGGGQGGGNGFDPSIFLPTDFWGKYTLAKK